MSRRLLPITTRGSPEEAAAVQIEAARREAVQARREKAALESALLESSQKLTNLQWRAAGKTPPRSLTPAWAADITPRLSAGGTLVKGLLDQGAMSVVFAPSNAGKSFFCLDLAMHVAMAWDWRGRKVKQKGAVLYIAAEGGYGFANRVHALKLHYGLLGRNDVPLAVVASPVDLLDPEADTPRLVDLIREVEAETDLPVVLAIVDTLSRAMVGGDENGSKDMTAFVRNVDVVRQAGPHVMVIHHSGKDQARGARGHNSLLAATDTEIQLTPTGQGKECLAKVTKQRDMPGGDTFPFTLETTALGEDEDGDPVTSAVVRHLDELSPKPQAVANAIVATARQRQLLAEASKLLSTRGEEFVTPDGEVVSAAKVTDWRAAVLDAVGEDQREARRKEFGRDIQDMDTPDGPIRTAGEGRNRVFWLPATTPPDKGVDEVGESI